MIGVPPVATLAPGEHGSQGHEEVVDSVGHDHVIVDTHDGRHNYHADTHTCKRYRMTFVTYLGQKRTGSDQTPRVLRGV